MADAGASRMSRRRRGTLWAAVSDVSLQPPVPPPPFIASYATPGVWPYESAGPRARTLVTLTKVGIAFQALYVLLQVKAIRAHHAAIAQVAAGGASEAEAADALLASTSLLPEAVLDLLSGAFGIWALVVWMMWVHRTYRNLPALGATDLRFSPGWAVGYYFIPVLQFFRPFQVMRETWRASDRAHDGGAEWQRRPAAPIIGWWWGLHISVIAGGLAMGVVMAVWVDDLTVQLAMAYAGLVLTVVYAVTLMIEIRLVRTLTARQEQRAAARGAAVPMAAMYAPAPAPPAETADAAT